MKKIELKSRKLLRTIFGGVSLTAMAFVFQACYGTKDAPYYDIKVSGTVRSKTTDAPIKGIKVTVNSDHNFGITDENGNFDFYASVPDEYAYIRDSASFTSDSIPVHFLDIDGNENGSFSDTTVVIDPAQKDEIKINILLEDKK